ncbi:FecR family protein [Plebeiibacterium marinum]|uniref:FecR domain-containing protein n=1 Tax=Plebeiibacterium marinum TaxID=2992111 RepID=A0AAE3SLM8_9BACT|nr:FecR family protein [Plebeiobacterium marinum]MCW3806635.1 FecR domain-containing protein [Plebeiobacterium marinum]
MEEQYYNISKLIGNYLADSLSDIEKQELDKWLGKDLQNRQLFEKLIANEFKGNKIKKYESINVALGWDKLKRKQYKQRQRKIVFSVLKYAAIIAIPVMLSVFVFKDQLYNSKPAIVQSISPGKEKAILVLSNGKDMILDESSDSLSVVKEHEGNEIQIQNRQLSYQNTNVKELVYNKLITPIGCEYEIILGDGTVVKLNCDSELRYPVTFVGEQRVVYLTGEAYFKVTKSSNPFIVKTPDADIQVLGTTFNVFAYQNEDRVQTTLIEGSVQVSHQASSVIIEPGEQAVYSRSGQVLKSLQVDTDLYTSWINGEFRFEGESLESAMKKFARWYDIDVKYLDEDSKNVLISGKVDRFEDFNVISGMIEKITDVKIRIDQNVVSISK